METKRILIVVKTYPHPSNSYQELVCTAGMLQDGSFVRLYPVDFRYRPRHQWYEKYQWIEVEVEKNSRDTRPESYRPNLDSIRLIGEPLSTKNAWAERKAIVLARPAKTMCELRKLFKSSHTSLGVIKPWKVSDLVVQKASSNWEEKHQNALSQFSLFAPNKKPLIKIPYRFSYHFYCDGECRGHKMCITDWELGALFLNERQRLGSDERAAVSVKTKFLNDICSQDKETYFFVGNVHFPRNSWVIVGCFYPKKMTAIQRKIADSPSITQAAFDL